MDGAITDVIGIHVGHAHNLVGLTGCTVVLCENGAVAGVDVRGLAPGTRETDLCRPGTIVEKAHAIVLTGGSAFGLDAASGVMRYLYERGIGYETGIVPVPIVPAAVLFDLGIGDVIWPDADMGYTACLAARHGAVAQGCVGAGTGATVGKVLGLSGAMKSGIGTASVRVGDVTVGALVAVNAFGDVVDPDDLHIIAGARNPAQGGFVDAIKFLQAGGATPSPHTNTTIGVIATDAALTADGVQHLASSGHDGLARAIHPVHTLFDGDTLFALATGEVETADGASITRLAVAAATVVQFAVINAVLHATPDGGLPAATSVHGTVE